MREFWKNKRARRWLPGLPLLVIPILYLATLARTLVLGDPTEYALVANVLGIAHPPGYAFITLVGKLFQTLNPLGEIPWRMHLLAATAAVAAALFIYGAVRTSGGRLASVAALFAALTAATASDVWQHAIHTNPHIITATFLVANLYLLTRWHQSLAADASGERARKWLLLFSFSAGLGLTHHPLTLFGFPAYALFILVTQPDIVRQGRLLLAMVATGMLGLLPLLYYPLRSPMQPVFGPHDMHTLSGFLDHVLARGLTESLPFYGLADQPGRLLVFWSLLRLQFSITTIALAPLGLVWLARRGLWRLALLYGVAFLGNYLFVISLRAQDIMAYLLGPFLVVALLAGFGLRGVLAWLRARWERQTREAIRPQPSAILLTILFLLGPILQIGRNLPHISLAAYSEGADYIAAVFDRFEGSSERAVLLHDWERMTPLWYTRFVEERWPDPADVRPEFVSTERTWLENVYDYLPGGPVYLSGYRADVVAAGFRLRPRGPFYQVVEPGDSTIPPELTPLAGSAGEIEVVAYGLPQRELTAGDRVPLTLAWRAPVTPTAYYVPSFQLGDVEPVTFTFTTDSHLITPLWRPGEVIVERFDLPLPHDLAAGDYPLTLAVKNLSTDTLLPLRLDLGTLQVANQQAPPPTQQLLANLGQRVGLVSASAASGRQWRSAPWDDPLRARAGDTVNLILQWQSLAATEESYTVFVHLIDAANRPLVTLDYTPLGGSAPTHLWIPKWLPGQRLLDPYRLPLPPDLPPGQYYVEVGMYEMVGGRRLHTFDTAGNLTGDRVILGSVQVE